LWRDCGCGDAGGSGPWLHIPAIPDQIVIIGELPNLGTARTSSACERPVRAPADWVLKDAWAENIRKQGIPLAVWPDVEDFNAIEMFIGWRYPEGIFSKV
jgi:hypothetical protein